ncbi:MAG: hypothetical protein ACE5F5_04540 [Acidimicrobiia bacterium]
METLGFFEVPEAVPTWSTSVAAVSAQLPESEAPQRSTRDDFLTSWEPAEPRALGKRVRWGLALTLTLLVASLSSLALWLYRQPEAEAAQALTRVQDAASRLDQELMALDDMNASLLAPDQDLTQATAVLLTVDELARSLFESSVELSPAQAELKVRAADAASQALEAARQLDDLLAYHAAMASVLVAPSMETDPELITLEEAARLFGEWRAGFDRIRTNLPDGVLPEVTAELNLISAELETIQRQYLDALRSGTMATEPQQTLSLRLVEASQILGESLGVSRAAIAERIERARSALAPLVG